MSARAAMLVASIVSASIVTHPANAQVAIRGERVHTMAGAPIADGVVLVGRNGRIERVGGAAQVPIPAGYRTFSAKVVTPGFVDAHSVVGLAGHLNSDVDQDQLEKSDPIQPELRAVDAYNARERLVEFVRSYGVTTLHTGHGPGALMSGQTMIVKTRGDGVDAALLDSSTMVAMTLGPDVTRAFTPKSPGTRAKGVAMIRAELVKAQEYARKRRAPAPAKGGDAQPAARDLGLETLAKVLDGSIPALITAQGAVEILDALRLQREFGFRLILDGAAEAPVVIDRIIAAKVPVILHPTMVRPSGTTAGASLETAKALRQVGVRVALQSGFEGYVPKTRVVLFEAAVAAANGLSFDEALATITIDAARIIGIERRVGSIETGKDGDLVLFDGDPFEYTTHVCTVLIEGRPVSEGCR